MDGAWCPACGYTVEPGSRSCGNCGQQLAAAAGAAPVPSPSVTVVSPGAPGRPPMSAPSMSAAPPPPAPDSRLPYPPPPGLPGPTPLSAPPGSWPAGPQSAPQGPGQSQPPMSDTQRMLAPQGLFQPGQPKPFDWQQPWSVPAAVPGPPQQDPGQPGMSSTLPHGMDSLPPAPPAPYPGQPGGQYPQPGGYPPGAGYPAGGYGPGGYPPQPMPGYSYGPGQYPPGGQYGAGFPGGPSGPRGPWDSLSARLRLPKGPLGPAIVAAILVLVIAGAVALAVPHGGSNSSVATGATIGPTTSSSASATANPAERQAAERLSGLLSQSGADHSDVVAAVGNVESCGKDLAKDAQILNKSAANRRALLAKLAQLPGRSALNAAMLADLTRGWQASAQVDSDLAKWASAAARHCKKGNPNDPNLAATVGPNNTASEGKAQFATLWNRLARRYGLATVQSVTL